MGADRPYIGVTGTTVQLWDGPAKHPETYADQGAWGWLVQSPLCCSTHTHNF
jgi:hypothetical protein